MCQRWRSFGRFRAHAVLMGLLISILGACEQDRGGPKGPTVGKPPEAPALTADLAARGKEVYANRCSVCHGPKGRGDGTAAYFLQPRPRDFVSDGFRFVSTKHGPSDADLFRTITRGMPGSAMPPWEHLPSSDRWAVVAEVRRLVRDGLLADELARGTDRDEAEEYVSERTTPGEPVAIPPEPPKTLETIERGRMLYLQACASCHDADGRGLLRRDLKDGKGFPIYARDLTRGVFKGSATAEQIALRMLAGIPGTPMPSYAHMAKTPADLWAIVHFVRSLVPPSAEERVVQKRRVLRAVRVKQTLRADLASPAWAKAEAAYVALMPLRWDPARTDGMLVRALHDGKRVAVRITWADATENRLALRTQDFCDGVAIQLSRDPNPPLFTMGSVDHPVAIWNWKALWEADAAGHQDV